MCSKEPLEFLDCLLLRACILKNFQSSLKEPKALIFFFCNLLQRLPLLSDFTIKKHPLWCFQGRVLMDDVLPPKNFSSGENDLCYNKTLFLYGYVITDHKESGFWSLLEFFKLLDKEGRSVLNSEIEGFESTFFVQMWCSKLQECIHNIYVLLPNHRSSTVSYTHLTLPTKRIV